MELWKDVIGFEDYYQVSNFGNIRSKDRVIFDKNFSKSGKPFDRKRTFNGKVLKSNKVCDSGHLSVAFYKNGRSQGSRLIHRVVAEHFIQNPLNLPIVDHIDWNPKNNNVDNLEWVDYDENIKHAWQTGLAKPIYGKANNSYKHGKYAKKFVKY